MDRENLIKLISEKMKLVRTEADFTQDHMAEILGISKKTLVQIEKQRITANWTTVAAFCSLFRDSQLLQSVLGGDPLEVVSIVAFEHYEGPLEKTMGGKVWWREIKNKGRFRLQQNLISKHYRILDEFDRRWSSSFDEDYINKRLRELSSD
ncbi:MAG: transcriptional regulator [Firmicutes bacterium HGW-Firmicutes-14]|nr:MAG: transcriptional regulator [Firmicutes bacterium HGW-Firmicutes-14]